MGQAAGERGPSCGPAVGRSSQCIEFIIISIYDALDLNAAAPRESAGESGGGEWRVLACRT
jgi:hypothetical protein